MDKKGLVIVLGESLLMDGIGTSLRSGQDMSVVRLDAFRPDLEACVKSLDPELIVFELDAPRPCTILSLLREQPGTTFFAVDTSCSQVIMLNSRRHAVQNLKEFCQLAQTGVNNYEAGIRKGGNETEKTGEIL